MADLGGYADHTDALAATEVVSGTDADIGVGVGAVRRCTTPKDQSWTEVVTEWEEGRRYRLDVHTDTYPFPLRQLFRRFSGTWTIEPTTTGSRVSIEFESDVRGGPFLRPLVALLARSARTGLEETLDSYGHAARMAGVAG